MRIAMMQSSFPGADRPAALASCARAGAEGLEVTIGQEELDLLVDKASLSALVQSARSAGLAIPSLCVLANIRTDGLVRQSSQTEAAVETVRQAIDAAGVLAAGVVMVPFFQKAAIETEQELLFACDKLAELGELAEQAGVMLGVESMLSLVQKRFMLDHTGGGAGVRHYFDTGNVMVRRLDPATELRELGNAGICGIHFKDVKVRENSPADWSMLLGQGAVDFPAVAQALKAIGYNGWVVIETPPLDDPEGSAAKNIAYARKVLSM